MKIENYQIGDWEDLETGVFLDENDDWILIKSIPSDYEIDGYKLLNKSYVENRFETENSEIIQKVLELKEIEIKRPKDFKFKNTLGTLKWLEEIYGCFEFQEEEEEDLFYGVLESFDIENFSMDSIQSDGIIDLDFDEVFKIKEVRTISFESDYFRSISLLYNYNKQKNI